MLFQVVAHGPQPLSTLDPGHIVGSHLIQAHRETTHVTIRSPYFPLASGPFDVGHSVHRPAQTRPPVLLPDTQTSDKSTRQDAHAQTHPPPGIEQFCRSRLQRRLWRTFFNPHDSISLTLSAADVFRILQLQLGHLYLLCE